MEKPLWGPDERTQEKITRCRNTFDDLSSTNEWSSGEAEQNASEYAQGILLGVYDRLGQISAAVVGTYNCTQHSKTGISPFMMLSEIGVTEARASPSFRQSLTEKEFS